jgi:hypothetical protein
MRIPASFAAAFAPAALLLATPAAAVTVTSISGASATVITEQPGLLEVDFALSGTSPVTLGLAPSDADETAFDFNSVVDIFTGVAIGQNARLLIVTLESATFEQIGSITPAFAGYSWSLNASADQLVIAFDTPGEPFGVQLGTIGDPGSYFRIAFAPAAIATRDVAPTSGSTRLSIALAVPEPATWAMLILGFGLVGTMARRRAALA